MSSQQPVILGAGTRKRSFATSATALQALIINEQEEILLLMSPTEPGWQVISGALEAGETVLDGVLRETREEAGEAIRVRPLGTVHVETFHYDENVRYMIGIYYLLAYEGGQIQPGDDMAGSEVRWLRLDELKDTDLKLNVTAKPWMLKRGVELYRLWKDKQEVLLQPTLEE